MLAPKLPVSTRFMDPANWAFASPLSIRPLESKRNRQRKRSSTRGFPRYGPAECVFIFNVGLGVLLSGFLEGREVGACVKTKIPILFRLQVSAGSSMLYCQLMGRAFSPRTSLPSLA